MTTSPGTCACHGYLLLLCALALICTCLCSNRIKLFSAASGAREKVQSQRLSTWRVSDDGVPELPRHNQLRSTQVSCDERERDTQPLRSNAGLGSTAYIPVARRGRTLAHVFENARQLMLGKGMSSRAPIG
jgi:hypothetical protein